MSNLTTDKNYQKSYEVRHAFHGEQRDLNVSKFAYRRTNTVGNQETTQWLMSELYTFKVKDNCFTINCRFCEYGLTNRSSSLSSQRSFLHQHRTHFNYNHLDEYCNKMSTRFLIKFIKSVCIVFDIFEKLVDKIFKFM